MTTLLFWIAFSSVGMREANCAESRDGQPSQRLRELVHLATTRTSSSENFLGLSPRADRQDQPGNPNAPSPTTPINTQGSPNLLVPSPLASGPTSVPPPPPSGVESRTGGTPNIGAYQQAIPRLIREQDEIQRAAERFERTMDRYERQHRAKAQEFQRQEAALERSIKQLGAMPRSQPPERSVTETQSPPPRASAPSYSPGFLPMLSSGGAQGDEGGISQNSGRLESPAQWPSTEQPASQKGRGSKVTHKQTPSDEEATSPEKAPSPLKGESPNEIIASVSGSEGDLVPARPEPKEKHDRRGAAHRSPFSLLENLMPSETNSLAANPMKEEPGASAPGPSPYPSSEGEPSSGSRAPASYGSAPLEVNGPKWNLSKEDVAEAKRDLASQVQAEVDAAQGILGENSPEIFKRVKAVYLRKSRAWHTQGKEEQGPGANPSVADVNLVQEQEG